HDREVTMDTVAEMRNSRVFIPARFIAEALDAKVYWDGDRQTVVILTKAYIENHLAITDGYTEDIDNPWLAYAFYERYNWKIKNYYKSADEMKDAYKGALPIIAGIKVEQDEE